MTGRPRIAVEHKTASFAIGTFKNLLIWVAQGHTNVAELQELRVLFGMLAKARGDEPHVSLIILYPSDSTMSGEERRVVTKLIEESKHRRLASATAVLATGVMAAVHRSILTGINLLVPPPHPNRITASIDEAISFVHPHVVKSSGPITQADVRAMIDELYEALKS